MNIRINVREQSLSIVDGGALGWGGMWIVAGWKNYQEKSKLFSFVFMTH